MTIDVKQDNLNIIELSDLGISLEAVEDKIMILVDGYRSGYECNTCKTTGKVSSDVVQGALRDCPDCKGKGRTLEIPDNAKSKPSTGVVVSMGPKTDYMVERTAMTYWSREMQRTAGTNEYEVDFEQFKEAEQRALNCSIQIGTRVVFGVHVGTPIPFKGNIHIQIMRQHEPLCKVFGSDVGDKEILDYSKDTIGM